MDETASVYVATWLPFAAVVCIFLGSLAARLLLRRPVSTSDGARRLHLDDWLVLIAVVFALGASICTTLEATSGLGKLVEDRPEDQLEQQLEPLQKAAYVSQFFYVASLSAAQAAALALIASFPLNKLHRLVLIAVSVFAFGTFLLGTFGTLFQCHPTMWDIFGFDNGQVCMDQSMFWGGFGLASTLVDLATVALVTVFFFSFSFLSSFTSPTSSPSSSAPSAAKTSVSQRTRYLATTCFAARLCTIPLVVLRAWFIAQAQEAQDSTAERAFLQWRVAVATQVGLAIALVAACAMYLPPVVRTLRGSDGRSCDEEEGAGAGVGFVTAGKLGSSGGGGEGELPSPWRTRLATLLKMLKPKAKSGATLATTSHNNKKTKTSTSRWSRDGPATYPGGCCPNSNTVVVVSGERARSLRSSAGSSQFGVILQVQDFTTRSERASRLSAGSRRISELSV